MSNAVFAAEIAQKQQEIIKRIAKDGEEYNILGNSVNTSLKLLLLGSQVTGESPLDLIAAYQKVISELVPEAIKIGEQARTHARQGAGIQ